MTNDAKFAPRPPGAGRRQGKATKGHEFYLTPDAIQWLDQHAARQSAAQGCTVSRSRVLQDIIDRLRRAEGEGT